MIRGTAIVAIAFATLSACAVGPDYRKPRITPPPAFSDTKDLPAASAAVPEANLATWWMQFHDPRLNHLIARAMQGNLDLQVAASRIREAREQVGMAGAAGLPSVNADGEVDHTHLSRNSGISQLAKAFSGGQCGQGGNGLALPGGAFTSYTLGFDASWELDVFGGVRRSLEAARARAEQAVWNRRDGEISITAEVAADYFTLRTLQRQIAIAQNQIKAQRHTLALVEARYRRGFVTGLDLQQQRAQLASTQASLPDLDAQAAAQMHALAVLLGEPPEALEADLSVPAAPPSAADAPVPVGLPSDLLRRRPDIRAAERALAASDAEIGVATADLFPKFNLTGVFDFVSLGLKNLLESSSRQYSGTGAISWPVFSGGKIRANIRVTKEQSRQALLAYRASVLGALRDVEDALARYGQERTKNRELREALADARSATRIARAQYQAGLVDFNSVLATEEAEFNIQDHVAQSDGTLDRDLASLYKALGGGWQP